MDNLFERTNYAKFCMSPSLDRTLPESVISQENNSPFTLYIKFHKFTYFLDSLTQPDMVHGLNVSGGYVGACLCQCVCLFVCCVYVCVE